MSKICFESREQRIENNNRNIIGADKPTCAQCNNGHQDENCECSVNDQPYSRADRSCVSKVISGVNSLVNVMATGVEEQAAA